MLDSGKKCLKYDCNYTRHYVSSFCHYKTNCSLLQSLEMFRKAIHHKNACHCEISKWRTNQKIWGNLYGQWVILSLRRKMYIPTKEAKIVFWQVCHMVVIMSNKKVPTHFCLDSFRAFKNKKIKPYVHFWQPVMYIIWRA